MRIEINANQFSVSGSSPVFHTDFNRFISDADSMIACFATVKQSVYELSGGVGNMADAVDQLDIRIQQEEERRQEAVRIQGKAEQLWTVVQSTDRQVADLVAQNQEELYQLAPYTRPEPDQEAESFLGQAWDWLCGVGEAIADGVSAAIDWVGESLGKLLNSAKEFYYEHKKVIDTVLIVVGAIGAIVAVVATGGLALVPLLTAVGVSGTIATVISATVAVVAVVSTVASSTLNIADIWAEIDDPTFNAWQNGLNIVSGVTNFVYNVGTIYNSVKGYKYEDIRNYVKQSFDKNDIPRGGGYATVRQNSVKGEWEAHECPPISSTRPAGETATTSDRIKANLPSVRMEKVDHMKTKSYGRRNIGYVNKQRELLNSGKFAEAFKMDIKDLEQFGFKYAKGIQEMKKYAKIYMKGWK